MPWGVAAAAIGAGGVIYSSQKTGDVVSEAGEREGAASAAAIARQEAAYEEAKLALSPYARQEQAASSQLMAQMGLAPPGGAVTGGVGGGGVTGAPMGTGGGDAWGFGADPRGTQGERQFDDFMQQVLGQNIVDSFRTGWHRSDGLVEGARRTEEMLKEMQTAGQIPDYYTIPSRQDLVAQSQQIHQDHGGNYDAIVEMYGAEGGLTAQHGKEGALTALEGFNLEPGAGDVQAGGPGGMMGGGQFIDPATGEVSDMGATMGGGPQVQNIQSIMERAGAEGLPEGFSEQYFEDLMADPSQDPELAAYLGLTPESMQVGAGYQETPAYMAAREAGVEAVDASAAAGGGLYSGRRGKALRDVGQNVEQQYYFDAMNRQEAMMGARRGERQAGLGRRGATYQAGQQRGQSYYNNYMQMLSGLADPTTTQNIAAMGTSLGKETSANLLSSARGQSQLEIGAAGAEGAMIADVTGGIGQMAQAYMGGRQTSAPTGGLPPYLNPSTQTSWI